MSLQDSSLSSQLNYGTPTNKEWSKELWDIIRNLNTYERAVLKFGKKYDDERYSVQLEASREGRRIFRFGSSVANKIDEFVQSGRLEEAQKAWLEKTCECIRQLSLVDGMGPIRAAELLEAGVDCVEDLYCHTDKLTRQQLIGLEHFQDLNEKIPQKEALQIGEVIEKAVRLLGSYEVVLCGGVRRGRLKCTQVECLVSTKSSEMPEEATKNIVSSLTSCGLIVDTICVGPTKFTGVCRLSDERPVRRLSLRVAASSQFPFLLLYHTGPPAFLRKLVKRALDRGFALNEHSLRRLNPNGGLGDPVVLSSEKEVFEFLDLPFIPPDDRNIFKESKKTTT